jgi:uncharacterized protein
MIAQIAQMVEKACARESNVFGYGIWTHHVTRVVAHGKRLAEIWGADPEIVEIAALLHDYASIKDAALYAEHHIHGAVEAGKLLTRFHYPAERIRSVQDCIATHRGSVPSEPKSAEAECLANADAMAHIEQVPALLALAFCQRGMGIDQGMAWVRAKLERSWDKLRPDVQERVQGQYRAALTTLTPTGGPSNPDGEPGGYPT